MPTTPFWTGPAVAATGVDPDDPIYWPTDEARFWLGVPGYMVELPSPTTYTPPAAAGEVEQGLMGGGSAVTRFDSSTRRWGLSWARAAGRDWQVLKAFEEWVAVGAPPWCFIGPEDNNRLTRAQSLCGAKHGEVEGWLSSSGAVAYVSTLAPRVVPAGVMTWVPGGTNAILAAGADGDTAGHPDVDHAPPYLPGMPTSWIVWAKVTGAAATVKARISGRLANGTIDTEVTGPNVVLNSTSWVPLWTVAAAGALGNALYLVPEIVCVSVGSTVELCCPSLSYQDLPGDWEHRSSEVPWTLAETITGAL
jgi:hypothetical protein